LAREPFPSPQQPLQMLLSILLSCCRIARSSGVGPADCEAPGRGTVSPVEVRFLIEKLPPRRFAELRGDETAAVVLAMGGDGRHRRGEDDGDEFQFTHSPSSDESRLQQEPHTTQMSPNPLDGKSRLSFFRRQGSRKSRFVARSARYENAWAFRRGLSPDNLILDQRLTAMNKRPGQIFSF
jgi:hypothetical protein